MRFVKNSRSCRLKRERLAFRDVKVPFVVCSRKPNIYIQSSAVDGRVGGVHDEASESHYDNFV